ncbi:MAG: ribonuclease III [Gemmatimonadota bacterium]|nr:ribonuclease III [Gemmatimonadota bacterium]
MRVWASRFFPALFGRGRPKDNRKNILSRLEQNIGYSFNDLNLLDTALSHMSFINENGREDTESNERLEFLGDAVLDLVVSEYLYGRLLASREGDLTRIKSSIVSRSALARQASKLKLEKYILFSKESLPSLRRGKASIISNSLEAVIGAIYLDGGLDPARKFICRKLIGGGKAELGFDSLQESKNRLLHISQVKYNCQPSYRVARVSGPDHDKQFVCEVSIRGDILGSGAGSNKKEAEKKAAREALIQLDELE